MKHNRGCDTLRDQKFGYLICTKEPTEDESEFCFLKVEARDAVTLLNIVYNHVLPGTTIFSDEWAAYNRTIQPIGQLIIQWPLLLQMGHKQIVLNRHGELLKDNLKK